MPHSDLSFFSYRDPRLTFFGKWQEEDKVLSTYGTICFVKLVFQGDCVGIVGKSNTPIEVLLDSEKHALDIDGEVFFRTFPGIHRLTLKICFQSAFSIAGIRAENLLSDPAPSKKPYIKFIGDSITNAYPGFVGAAASLLDCHYSCDSVGGMSLCDGWGWPKEKSPKVGMESFYFRASRDQFDLHFDPYAFGYDASPDALVVFLGTNDYLDCPEDKADGNVPHFARHYAAFIERLSSLYPSAAIYILEPLSDKYCRQEGIEAAFALMKEALSGRVTLIPTHNWGIELSPDGTHPSGKGYTDLGIKMANYLAEKL